MRGHPFTRPYIVQEATTDIPPYVRLTCVKEVVDLRIVVGVDEYKTCKHVKEAVVGPNILVGVNACDENALPK